MLVAAGIAAGTLWAKRVGPLGTVRSARSYLGSFGASHPLAKHIGAWPAVLTAAGTSAAAAWLVADRRG